MRDLKYSKADGETDVVVDEDNSLAGSGKLYYGYDVRYKVKNDVKKEVSYVPDRKIRGKNTLIGGVLITQYRSERASGFNCSRRFPLIASTCRDFGRDSVAPFGVDPVFSRSSSLFGGVEMENNIEKYYNVSELPPSGVPNGFTLSLIHI